MSKIHFQKFYKKNGYKVINTTREDFDLNPKIVEDYDVQVCSALEILEHLVSPMPLLQNLPGKKLIVTVPLKLWFSSAYKSKTDKRDRHYHEFEDWQFDWLLKKSGWKIVHKEKWTHPIKKIGIRPILRRFIPRYYAIYAERE